jgi:hypothetical protein
MVPQSLAALDEPQIPNDAVGPIAHAGQLATSEITSDSHEWRMPSAADVSIFAIHSGRLRVRYDRQLRRAGVRYFVNNPCFFRNNRERIRMISSLVIQISHDGIGSWTSLRSCLGKNWLSRKNFG